MGKQIKELAAYLNTLKSFSSLTSGIYNIKHFGAKGDGIADDTQAFKDAMLTVPVGGTLWLPEGVYNISDTIVRAEPITIMGSGSRGLGAPSAVEHGTIIQMIQGSTNKNVFEFGYRNSNNHNGVNLSGLSINGGASSGADFDIIQIWNLHRHININDLFLRNATGAGYRVTKDDGYTGARNVYLYASVAENCANGFYLSNDYNLNLISCYAGFGMQNAFRISNTNQVKINNCWTLSGVSNNAIWLETGSIKKATIIGNHISDAGNVGIFLSRPLFGGVIADNIIVDPAIGAAIYIPVYGIQTGSSITNCLIHSNVINDYTSAPIYNGSPSTRVFNNFDGKTAKFDNNQGAGVIADGQTAITITHNLSSYLASNINIQATSSKNETLWVDNITDTQFTVNRAASSGALAFNWIGKSVMERKP